MIQCQCWELNNAVSEGFLIFSYRHGYEFTIALYSIALSRLQRHCGESGCIGEGTAPRHPTAQFRRHAITCWRSHALPVAINPTLSAGLKFSATGEEAVKPLI